MTEGPSAHLRGTEHGAEFEVARIAALVEASDEAILSTDLQDRIRTWNPAAARIFGYPEAAAIGRRTAMLVPADRRHEHAELVTEVLAGRAVTHAERVLVRSDGRLIDALITLSPMFDAAGRVIGGAIIARDITDRKQIERVNAEFAAIVEASDDAIIGSDVDMTITSWNRGAERIYGYTPAEAIGQSVRVLFGAGREPEAAQLQGRLLRGERVHLPSAARRHKDGAEIHLSIIVSPVRDTGGRVIGAGSVSRDITEQRREANERERMLHDLEDAQRLAKVGSWMWDPSSDGATWSHEMFRIFGRDPAAGPATGQEFFQYVHPVDRERLSGGYADVFGRGPEFQLDYRIVAGDGTEKVLLGLGRADPDRPGCYRGTVQDVSDQRRAEQARAELLQASARAEAASRAKSEFLARMSHELRTPLNSIIGFGQLLDLEELNPGQRESVDYILKGGRHLLELINEVLDIARIESGRIPITRESLSLAEVVREAVVLVAPLADERGVTVDLDVRDLDGDGYVLADRNRLTQVLLNLLSNAIKYNRVGGRVTVACRSVGRDHVRVEVTDTGRGIRPEQLADLFVPFERLGADQGEIEGTGLGLTLSKGLVEAMGGSIAVDSRPEAGTTFTVQLAAADRRRADDTIEEPEEPNAERRLAGTRPRRILYIEDNLSNLTLVERILSRHADIELISAIQGSIGLELARKHRPDLVLLDLHLPDMSGLTVLERLRAEDHHTPVIVLTADATPGQTEAVRTLGADDYLTKPLDVRRFLDVIRRNLAALARDRR